MKRRPRGIAALTLLFALAILAQDGPDLRKPDLRKPGTDARIGAAFFGISISPLNGKTPWPVPVPFGTCGKNTAGTYWPNLEPSNGAYDWTPLDIVVNSAQAAGAANIMYTFFQSPQWASSNPTQSCSATAKTGILGCAAPPSNLQDWSNFVTAVATRYKGRIHYYEPWNEPDVTSEYSGTIPQMLSLAQSVYQIVKSIDPSAVVLTPSVSVGGVLSANPGCKDSTCWLAQYLAAGGGQYADGVGFHGKACDTSTGLCVMNHIACPATALNQCAADPLVNQINDARLIMANNHLEGMPLIDTEGGWSDIVGANDVATAPADQQAAYVSRFFIIQASENLPIAIYFSWLTNPANGLLGFGSTSAETENNQVYQQTHDWLLGATMRGPCSKDGNSVWTCALTRQNGYSALIVWSDSATSYMPTRPYASYTDVHGNTSSLNGTVPIGILPILLQQKTAFTFPPPL